MYKQLFKEKDFLKIYFARCISCFGDSIDDIAFAMLIYNLTESTFLTSYVFAIKMFFTFTSIFTAAIADRSNKKIMIFISEFSQAIILIILGLMYINNNVNIPFLIIFVTLQAFFSTIGNPAKNSLIVLAINKDMLLEARALLSVSIKIIQVCAYALSAILIARLGILNIILIDSLTFIISSILFINLSYNDVVIPYKSFGEFKKDIKEGFLFVKNKNMILFLLIVSLCGNILMCPVEVLMPAYFSQYTYSSSTYSLFVTFITLGSIAITIIIPRICKKVKEIYMLIVGISFGGVGCFILAFPTVSIMSYIAAIFFGFSFALVSILNVNILQAITPKNMVARVFSIFKCISYLASPVGMFIAGGLGEIIDLRYIFLLVSLFMMVLTCTSYLVFKTFLNNSVRTFEMERG